MHVEISVALNFVMSYLYDKLPRRRVDLFVDDLEKGLKRKFEGHWYPEKPNKGSGFRCIKINGEEVDPVIVEGATRAGVDIAEVKSCLPEDLTLWIDPSEVSYKLGEKGPVKILYSDWKEEDSSLDKTNKEVQAVNHTFNPEAQSFNPEAQSFNLEAPSFNPEAQSFNPSTAPASADVGVYNAAAELQAFYMSDTSQSFQPIDSLSSSLSNLSVSPSSPVPPPGTWSTATSPSSTLFNSATSPTASLPSTTGVAYLNPRPAAAGGGGGGGGGNASIPQFTAASFAQTKFGSTKLKTNAKRPNRLSPTEFGNFFRQQQRTYAGPPRPRSLSPRDPRVEFLLDQQHRYIQQQQQQQQQQQRQMSPSMPYPPQYQIQQQQQQQQHNIPHSGMIPDLVRQHSTGISSSHSSPHLSPHMSPQGPATHTFQDLISRSTNPHHPQNTLPSPTTNVGGLIGLPRPTSMTNLGRAGASATATSPNQQPFNNRHPAGFSNSFAPTGPSSSPVPHHGSMSQLKAMSPDAPKSFVDGLNAAPVNYSSSLQHLLMAN